MALVSVVVPMYGVEDYLPACLSSLEHQTFTDVQFVLVDDDSPDGLADIANEWVARDPRFVYVHQSNRGPGPGGGRNGGLTTANGEYLLFIDADDVIEPDMIENMTAAARRANADLVTCNTARLVGGSVRRSEFHDISHPIDVDATTVARHPWLIYDSTPWNKLFRRSFFDDVVGEWPEQVLYEDIAAMTTAHLRSKSTAVLSARHYYWRVRGEGQITDTTDAITGDLAQLGALREGAQAIRRWGNDELLDWFSWKAYGFDLHWMTRKVARIQGESAYQLTDAMGDAIGELSERALEQLPARTRSNLDGVLRRDRGASRKVWRTALTARSGRLTTVSRSYDIAGSDPGARLDRWSLDGSRVTLTVSADAPSADPSNWQLEIAARPLLGPEPPEPHTVVSAVMRRGPLPKRVRLEFDFDLTRSTLAAADGLGYVAVRHRPSGAVGEISRSLQDRVLSRVQPLRCATTPSRRLVPFFDTNRLMLAFGDRTSGLVDARLSGVGLELWLDADLAAATDNVGLYSNHRPAPLLARRDRDDADRWLVDRSALRAWFAEGETLLGISLGLTDSPMVPVPLQAQPEACVGNGEIELIIGGYGQAFVRPRTRIVDELAPLAQYVRRERHVPGL